MFNLENMTIKKRLSGSLGIIIAFMVVLIGIGIWSLQNISGKLNQIVNVNNEKILLAQNIQNAIAAIDRSALVIALINDMTITKSLQDSMEEQRAVYTTSVEQFEKIEKTEKGKDLLASIKDNFLITQATIKSVMGDIADGNTQKARDMLAASLEVSKGLSETCSDLVKYQEEQISADGKAAQKTYWTAFILLMVCGIVVVVIAVALALWLTGSITKPLSQGVAVAQKIAKGDLTTHIEATGTDETGQLMNAMKNMVTKLQSIIGEVKTAAFNIASASHQLNANSELMSKGAGEQAGRAGQVATASEEMSQTVLDIAKNTSSIESSAIDTTQLAKNGETVVNRSVDKVKSIEKTIDQSALLIKSLGERSNQIGDIVNVINDIADQTNLLALNAAIEAARAGEQGRGFAVVADEVRKLAERTGNSTAEIGDMVKSIQDEVRQVVVSMENITKEVKAGVDLSTEAGDVLRNIVESVDKLHLMVQQIASATEEMASTSEEINKDIEMISSLSKETSGSSEQIAKASGELSQLSVNLENVVKGFAVLTNRQSDHEYGGRLRYPR
jgi:methyl-accepting chemotaxis protein